MLVSGVLNDQKTRTFTQYLSNPVVQNFNDFVNKRGRERERESEIMKVTVIFVLNRMKNNKCVKSDVRY